MLPVVAVTAALAWHMQSPVLSGAHRARVSVVRAAGEPPSLREQMLAYVKVQKERGVELTDEQKAMIAEFEQVRALRHGHCQRDNTCQPKLHSRAGCTGAAR